MINTTPFLIYLSLSAFIHFISAVSWLVATNLLFSIKLRPPQTRDSDTSRYVPLRVQPVSVYSAVKRRADQHDSDYPSMDWWSLHGRLCFLIVLWLPSDTVPSIKTFKRLSLSISSKTLTNVYTSYIFSMFQLIFRFIL